MLVIIVKKRKKVKLKLTYPRRYWLLIRKKKELDLIINVRSNKIDHSIIRFIRINT